MSTKVHHAAIDGVSGNDLLVALLDVSPQPGEVGEPAAAEAGPGAPFNLFISNVPGPTVDLYMCGARLEAVYPLSAIADGQGLNITVLGSSGKLNFGILADRSWCPT